jgi:hypothetical protein
MGCRSWSIGSSVARLGGPHNGAASAKSEAKIIGFSAGRQYIRSFIKLEHMRLSPSVALLVFFVAAFGGRARAEIDVYLLEVPDYLWYGGCFGTGAGNLMGYWDRHGFSNFYPNVLAPLNSAGANEAIRTNYVSAAHINDYWLLYESTGIDPYVAAGRPEHTPDCIGDFIGLSQRKWTNMNSECDGNIDAYSFVYWDSNGNRRVNFTPPAAAGTPVRDIQSGLREWTRWRGYDADVFTQLTDFNPKVPAGHGFTFNEMRAEIDAGYPVLLYLQPFNQTSRSLSNPTNMPRANPEIHGMMAYGYYIADSGEKYVHYRTSWGDSGGNNFIVSEWNGLTWQANLPVRGVIGYRPKPKITKVTRANGNVTVSWDGPASLLYDNISGVTTMVHRYVLERTPSLDQPFEPVTSPSADHFATVPECCGTAFFRVRLVTQ